jgi:hypothetical protein
MTSFQVAIFEASPVTANIILASLVQATIVVTRLSHLFSAPGNSALALF